MFLFVFLAGFCRITRYFQRDFLVKLSAIETLQKIKVWTRIFSEIMV